MKIEEMLQDYKDAHEIGRLDMFEELAYRYYQQAAELSALRERVERIEKAAVDLFQACSDLPLPEMDRMETEINAMSAALKGE